MNSRSSCSNIILTDFKVQFVQANVHEHRFTTNKLKIHLFLNSSPHLSLQTTPAAETCVLHILRPMHPHSLHLSAGNPSELYAVRVVYSSKIKAHLMSKLLLALKIQCRCRLKESVVLLKYLILTKAYKRDIHLLSSSKTQYQLLWERTICHLSKEK